MRLLLLLSSSIIAAAVEEQQRFQFECDFAAATGPASDSSGALASVAQEGNSLQQANSAAALAASANSGSGSSTAGALAGATGQGSAAASGAAGESANAFYGVSLCSYDIQQALFYVMEDCVKDILECRFGAAYTAVDTSLTTFYSLDGVEQVMSEPSISQIPEGGVRKLQTDPTCTLCLMYGLDCSAVCGCFPNPCGGDNRRRHLRRPSIDLQNCGPIDPDLSIADEMTQTCGDVVRDFVKSLEGEHNCLGHWQATQCSAFIRPEEDAQQ